MKEQILRYLSASQKMRIQSLMLNSFRLLHRKGKILLKDKFTIESIGKTSLNSFFGYYDITPFGDKNEVLFVQLDERLNVADVMLHDRNTKSNQKITSTNAWNWQQGCRLRWFPGSNEELLFNDFINGHYLARKVNVVNHEERVYSYPIYDIDNAGRKGITLNFERLGVKRPGYGYTCRPYQEPENLSEEGIDLIDLASNKAKRIITYSEIAETIGEKSENYSNNYINHLAFSPSGNRFLFFWLTIVKGFHKAYLLTYDLSAEKITQLETQGKVSHYLWLDEENILCTVYNEKNECSYVIYGLDGSKRKVFKDINYDGHPIWYKDGLILTDSYPDKYGFQRLVVCNLQSDETKVIAEIFHEPAISIERRTDLHPRYDSKTDTICIDANTNGKRKLLLLKKDETAF